MTKNKKVLKAIEEAEEIDYDIDGNAVIWVGLKSKEDFYDKYCDKSYKLLNAEMLEYIEKASKSIPANESLALSFSTEFSTTSKEKESMKNAIKRQYAEELVLAKKKLNRNLLFSLILTILGIGVLALGVVLVNLKLSSIIYDIVIIAAWVFIWDAFEMFFFSRPELKYKYHLMKRLINCKVYVKKDK